jgi:hypothetical protein
LCLSATKSSPDGDDRIIINIPRHYALSILSRIREVSWERLELQHKLLLLFQSHVWTLLQKLNEKSVDAGQKVEN